jgi:Lrp/AsnC family transcriptional regulator, leucine-responsive regulatory protein
MLDSLDFKILEHLLVNGRASWAELANILGLSAPSTAERVKKLEERGVILGYRVNLNYKSLDYSVTAFISLSLSHPKHISGFLKSVDDLSEVEECHHVAGEDDYLLKVRCKNTESLDKFLNEKLKILPGISRTRTTIALSSSKESPIKELNKH